MANIVLCPANSHSCPPLLIRPHFCIGQGIWGCLVHFKKKLKIISIAKFLCKLQLLAKASLDEMGDAHTTHSLEEGKMSHFFLLHPWAGRTTLVFGNEPDMGPQPPFLPSSPENIWHDCSRRKLCYVNEVLATEIKSRLGLSRAVYLSALTQLV